MSREALVATVLWRRTDVPGMEYFVLRRSPAGHHLEGTVFGMEEDILSRLDYAIECSKEWVAHAVSIKFEQEGVTRVIQLTIDQSQRWWDGNHEITSLKGQVDVDLSLTPTTNIFPIQRLELRDLPIGESRESTAGFVLFPQLSIEPLRQRYTKITERRFFYESPAHAFTTEIEVDARGLVVSYPPFWERAAIFLPEIESRKGK